MMITKLKAYQLGEVILVATISSLSVILNIVCSYFLLKERNDLLKKIIAAILIMIGIIFIKYFKPILKWIEEFPLPSDEYWE